MYKKPLSFFWLILLACGVKGQLSMTIGVPPGGILQKNQLWNIILVNAGQPANIAIKLTLLDANRNVPVMTGSSGAFIIPAGAKQLTANDIPYLDYEYLSADFSVDRSPSGFLPVGNYKACYTVYAIGNHGNDLLAEDCASLEVQPLAPPQLNIPFDKDTLETNYPQLSWLPPAPLNLFSSLAYDVTVVEVRTGQTAEEAIQENIPFFNIRDIKDLFLNYPAGYKALDTSRLYAWQVLAKNNDQYVAASEVWTFRVKKNSLPVSPSVNPAYVRLKRTYEAGFVTCTTILKVAYNNEIGDTQAAYEIIDLEQSNEAVQKGIFQLRPGMNFLDITLDRHFEKEKKYMLRLLNSRTERWNVKFMIGNKK